MAARASALEAPSAGGPSGSDAALVGETTFTRLPQAAKGQMSMSMSAPVLSVADDDKIIEQRKPPVPPKTVLIDEDEEDDESGRPLELRR